jgi:hypothetical protein
MAPPPLLRQITYPYVLLPYLAYFNWGFANFYSSAVRMKMYWMRIGSLVSVLDGTFNIQF